MGNPSTYSQSQLEAAIARCVSKGYPAEIFSGIRSENDIVLAMGVHMKNQYLAMDYPASVFDSCSTPIEIKNAATAYREALIKERAEAEQRRLAHAANLARATIVQEREQRQLEIDDDDRKRHAILEYKRKIKYEWAWDKTTVFLSIYSGLFVSCIILYIFALFLDRLKPNDPESLKVVLENLHQKTWGFSVGVFFICFLIYLIYRSNKISNFEYRAYREEYFRPKTQPLYQAPAVITSEPITQIEKTPLQMKEERVIAKEKDIELDIRSIKADENLARAQRSVQLNELDDNISYAQKLGTYKNLVDKLSRTPTALPKQEKPNKLTAQEVKIKLDALNFEEAQEINKNIARGFKEDGEQIKSVESLYEKRRQDLLNGHT